MSKCREICVNYAAIESDLNCDPSSHMSATFFFEVRSIETFFIKPGDTFLKNYLASRVFVCFVLFLNISYAFPIIGPAVNHSTKQ